MALLGVGGARWPKGTGNDGLDWQVGEQLWVLGRGARGLGHTGLPICSEGLRAMFGGREVLHPQAYLGL